MAGSITRGQAAKPQFAGADNCQRRPGHGLVAVCAIERQLRFVGSLAFPTARFELAGLIIENNLAAIRQRIHAIRPSLYRETADRDYPLGRYRNSEFGRDF